MVAAPRVVKVLLQARASPMLLDGEKRLPLYRCPEYASTTRELLLRSLVAFGGSSLAAKQTDGKAMLSVQLLVRANGPVRELHVGNPEAIDEDDTQAQLDIMSPLGSTTNEHSQDPAATRRGSVRKVRAERASMV